MASDTELLEMSSNVYDSNPVNHAPIPTGWEYLSEGSRTYYEPDGRARGAAAGARRDTAADDESKGGWLSRR